MLKRIMKKVLRSYRSTSEDYIKHINLQGGIIGKHSVIFAPETVYIDLSRPYLVNIGDYCVITQGTIILTHDYSHSVLLKKYGKNIGDAKGVLIGDNVFIGMNSIILMGSKIGNNCIVGAGSLVTGEFPDDVVIGGNPARIICSLDEYLDKKMDGVVECAFRNVDACKTRFNRYPTIKEMGDAFAWLYLPRTMDSINGYTDFFCLPGSNAKDTSENFMASVPMFESYDSFLMCYEKWKLNEDINRSGGG